MSFKYSAYVIPVLGALCVAGVVTVVVAARSPMDTDFDMSEETSYDVRIPDSLEPSGTIPTMEEVVEKHLFVAARKATGQNTFPDLLVKGIYVGEESSAVFSLKYRPEANVRVWKGDVDSVISRITDSRDPRKPIVDFLSEWDIKEINFKGVLVEHIITGEVETYLVDYTPAKHVKDSAESGYGQGMLAENVQGGTKTAKTSTKQAGATTQQSMQQRMQAINEVRSMVQQMSPEQRAKFASRIAGSGGTQNQESQSQKSDNKSTKSSGSSKKSTKKR